MNQVTAVPIEQRAQVVKRARYVEIGNVDMPVPVRGTGLVKASALLRGLVVVSVQYPRTA